MAKPTSITALKRWVAKNISSRKQPSLAAYWALGQKVNAVRTEKQTPWKPLGEQVGIHPATLRQAMNFALYFTKSDVASLTRTGATWRVAMRLAGRKSATERQTLLAAMPTLMMDAKKRGVPQRDVVTEFIARKFHQEATPKIPAELPDLLDKLRRGTERFVTLFREPRIKACFSCDDEEWAHRTIRRKARALADVLGEAIPLIRGANRSIRKKTP
jgi:hypothetical protein